MEKNKIRSIPHPTHKNKLQVDQRSKRKKRKKKKTRKKRQMSAIIPWEWVKIF